MIIIPVLGLDQKRDTELDDYAQDKITKIDAEVAFAGVTPSTASVGTLKDEYVAALAAADGGDEADTAYKNQKRKELEEALTLQAWDISRIAGGDIVLFLRSGYEAKKQGSPTPPLDEVTTIIFRDYGKNLGELVPDWNTIANARMYEVRVSTDITDMEGTVIKTETASASKIALTGLPEGDIVYIQVKALGSRNKKSEWSSPVKKRVP